MSPVRTAPTDRDAEAGFEHQVPPRRTPLPETEPEDAIMDLYVLPKVGTAIAEAGGSKPLFQVFTEREERKATAVASHAPRGAWGQTYIDPRRCAAIADRLSRKGTLTQTGTDSYRLKSSESEHLFSRRS
ncbi:ATP-binding protein [Streptomyces sp. NPDC093064]|uniref:ATP-binding protein n=1 Tax=Streptomyces sp. NPDC093064 TaxID=3366020 RepID=UPI0038305D04